MINLTLKDGHVLSYDEENDRVLRDNVVDNNYRPTFIHNGNEEPTFFGFTHVSTGKVYDVFGNVSSVVDEDKIKL